MFTIHKNTCELLFILQLMTSSVYIKLYLPVKPHIKKIKKNNIFVAKYILITLNISLMTQNKLQQLFPSSQIKN